LCGVAHNGAFDLLFENDVGVIESALRSCFSGCRTEGVVVDLYGVGWSLWYDAARCGRSGARVPVRGHSATAGLLVRVVEDVVVVAVLGEDDPQAARASPLTRVVAATTVTRRPRKRFPSVPRGRRVVIFGAGSPSQFVRQANRG